METSNAPLVPASVPVITIERFVELTGLTPDTVRGQLQQGNLPLVKVGSSPRGPVHGSELQSACRNASGTVT